MVFWGAALAWMRRSLVDYVTACPALNDVNIVAQCDRELGLLLKPIAGSKWRWI